MKLNLKKFNINSKKPIPIDELIEKILYEPKIGYYSSKDPFGKNGDFITSPTISNLFSEMIAIWLISTWEKIGKPKKFNFIELGPGDGSLTKVIIDTLKKFPETNKAIKIYLYEKSKFLKKIQKKKIDDKNVKWITNFNSIKKGPAFFFGNEFFDAIPIKQYSNINNIFFEKCYDVKNEVDVNETFIRSNKRDIAQIKTFKTLKKLKFLEFPKKGFLELDPIIKKINKLSGGILLIDYGYLKSDNSNTLQAVMDNKKISMEYVFNNPGKADVTSLVNFNLLKEYFEQKKLKVKKIVFQKFFLERMGIIERARILKKKMTNKQQKYMSDTLNRLLAENEMGKLFKVIFGYKNKNNDFFGFE
tara:strand:+ start:755 stop:1834 length:1080 start_codon:yes stop_codon:yes gene_type:complete